MQSKLVRDRIPEIAEKEGTPVDYVIAASDNVYFKYLTEKFVEESNEYLHADQDHYLEELADILTIINTLAVVRGASVEELNKVYSEKLAEKGGYDKRIVLMADDPEPAADKTAAE